MSRTRNPVTLLLAGAMLVSGLLLVELGSRLSFLLDDWVFIVYRRGFTLDSFMQPDNEHFVAGPVAIWKLLIALFGIGSTLPYRIVSTAMFLLGAWLLFVWIRRRLGDWPALLATIPVLFLGAAFDDLLWFSSITFLGSMACGLGMLVALDRRDRRGDLLACVWLLGSLIFSSLWLAFAAGAVVDIALRRGERPWRSRIYLVAIPVLVYAAWWLGWGHEAESALSLHNLATTPVFVLNSIAAAIAAVLGLAIPVSNMAAPNGLDWGRPLTVLFVGLAAWRMYKLDRIPRSLWVVLAVGLAFWILGGLDVKPGREASDSRYQYTSVVFVLLFATELLRGLNFSRRLIVPALVVVGAAVLANVTFLHEAYNSYHQTSQIERADLGAVEIARDRVEPGFRLDEGIADTNYVSIEAGPYLSARDAYGSPAYSPAGIAAAPEVARVPADKVLASALGIALVPAPVAAPAARGGCRRLTASAAAPATMTLPAGGVALRADAPLQLALERFSASFPVAAGSLTPGHRQDLAIPADRSSRPWRLRLSGAGKAQICGLGAS